MGLSSENFSNGISKSESQSSPTKLTCKKVNPVNIPPLDTVTNIAPNRHDKQASNTSVAMGNNGSGAVGNSGKSRPPSSRVHAWEKPGGQGLEKRPEEMSDYLAPLVAPEEPGLSPIDERIESSAAFHSSRSHAVSGNRKTRTTGKDKGQGESRNNIANTANGGGVESLTSISGDLKQDISKLSEQLSKMDLDIEKFEENEQANKPMQESVDYSINIPAIHVPNVDILQKDAIANTAGSHAVRHKDMGDIVTVTPTSDMHKNAKSDKAEGNSCVFETERELSSSDEDEGGGLSTETSVWSVGTRQKSLAENTGHTDSSSHRQPSQVDRSTKTSAMGNRSTHNVTPVTSTEDSPVASEKKGHDSPPVPAVSSEDASPSSTPSEGDLSGPRHKQLEVVSSEGSSAVTSPQGSEPLSDTGSGVSGSYASALESQDESSTTLCLSASEDPVDMTQSMFVRSDRSEVIQGSTGLSVRDKAVSMEELQQKMSPMSSPRSAGTSPRSVTHVIWFM